MFNGLIAFLLSSSMLLNPLLGILHTNKSAFLYLNNIEQYDSKEFNWYYNLNKDTKEVTPPKETPFLKTIMYILWATKQKTNISNL